MGTIDLTCPDGHTVTITDPAENGDGWGYDGETSRVIDTATFPDGTVQEVERDVFVPAERWVTVKCNHPTPTDDDPRRLCGAVFTHTEPVEG